jgi:rhodanese-related sulfurtransferase
VFEHAGDVVPYGVLTGDALFIGDVGRPDLLASIGHTYARPLALAEVLDLQRAGTVVIDAREPQEFATGHLTGAQNVPADGRFAETAGSVVRPDQQLVVVAAQDREEEVVVRLARIGFDRVAGYLRDPEGAFLDAPEHLSRASRLTAPQLAAALRGPQPPFVLDVRNPGEVRLRRLAVARPSRRLRRSAGGCAAVSSDGGLVT